MKQKGTKLKKTWTVREFLRFVVPSVASMFVFSTYSIVDGIFVSHGVGELALGAVNLCTPFLNAMFAVAVLLSVGTSYFYAERICSGWLCAAFDAARAPIPQRCGRAFGCDRWNTRLYDLLFANCEPIRHIFYGILLL